MVEQGELCDDGNDDPSDGCLSDCSEPRTCAEVLAVEADAPSGSYMLVPDGDALETYCDMETDGGGWTLVAKINHSGTDDLPEPSGWFDMALQPEALSTDELILEGGLASHGAGRFAGVLTPDSTTRFELFAAEELDQRATWFKRVASEASFTQWFAADAEPSWVCTDLEFSQDCGQGTISSQGGLVTMENMLLSDYGYTNQSCTHLSMRLDDNGLSTPSAVCSCTLNADDNAWADSYQEHWGNAMLIWLKESVPAEPLPPLVGYWPFNGDAQDGSGSNIDLDAVGDPEYLDSVSSGLGTALTLDGDDGAVGMNFVKFSSEDATFVAWVYAADAAGDWNTIAKNWGTTETGQFHFGLGSDGANTLQNSITGGTTATAPADLPVGEWVHVAFVFDSAASEHRLYVNGDVAVTVNYAPPLNPGSATGFGVGLKPNNDGSGPAPSYTGHWVGSIDEVGMYEAALTSLQLQALLQDGLDGVQLDGSSE